MVKTNKKILAAIIFAVIFSFLIPQNIFSAENNEQQTVTSITGFDENSSSFFNSNQTASNDALPQRSHSMAGAYVKMILMLILVVALIWLFFWYIKHKNLNLVSQDDYLRKVSSIEISPGKTVQVVSLLEQAYVLGVSEDGINLIDKIEDKELVAAMNMNADKKQNVRNPVNFSEVLDSILTKGKKTKSIYSEAESKVSNIKSPFNHEG